MLVYRPHHLILKFRGHDVIIRSENQTQDATSFDKDAVDLRVLLVSALGDIK